VNICQPPSGCRVNGELCAETSDCCGAAGTGLPGDGTVQCEKDTGASLGRCGTPSSGTFGGACNPQGNICHYQDYATCNISSKRNDCCGDINKSQGFCQLDTLGLPRCNGLSACVPAGGNCSSAIDCCNHVPCVPDSSGVLRCLEPVDAGPTCVAPGGTCSFNGDCCPGTVCVEPPGSTQGTCGNTGGTGGTTGSGGSGGTGGTGTGGTTGCADYGQICTVDGDCCNGVSCYLGLCQFKPR
jgi:hypothetical protein